MTLPPLHEIPVQLQGDDSGGFHSVYLPRFTRFCSSKNDFKLSNTSLSVSNESPTTTTLPVIHKHCKVLLFNKNIGKCKHKIYIYIIRVIQLENNLEPNPPPPPPPPLQKKKRNIFNLSTIHGVFRENFVRKFKLKFINLAIVSNDSPTTTSLIHKHYRLLFNKNISNPKII